MSDDDMDIEIDDKPSTLQPSDSTKVVLVTIPTAQYETLQAELEELRALKEALTKFVSLPCRVDIQILNVFPIVTINRNIKRIAEAVELSRDVECFMMIVRDVLAEFEPPSST